MAANNSKTEQRGVLIFLSGGTSEEMVKLRRDATIIGREKGDIVIEDSEISATHCQIQEIDGTFNVFDMNSTNGTYVNNERILKAKLKPGDIITLGSTSLKFALKNEDKVRHVSTVFKPSSSDKGRTASLIETLIESELKDTQYTGVKLNVTYANGKKEEIELPQRIIYIGRASSFGLFDRDPEISRRHLLIKLNNSGEIFVEDQGSTNGSFINGKKIRGMHQVRTNDEVKIGDTHLKILPLAS